MSTDRVPSGVRARSLAVWLVLRTSWRAMPGMTCAAAAALVASAVVVPLTAWSMRWVVDSMSTGPASQVVLAALLAAVACAAGLAVDDASTLVVRTATDRLGRLHLHPAVHRSISSMQGLEHLERSDYLDRVTIVRGGTSRLAGNLWFTGLAAANVVKVALTTALLATAAPVLLVLCAVALVPGYCYERGQRAVKRTEVDTAEDFRLQQHLFDVATSSAGLKDVWLGNAAQSLLEQQRAVWDRLQRRRVRAQLVASAWTAAGWLVFVGAFVAALFLLTVRAADGRGTPGDIVLAIVVSATLQQAVADAVRTIGTTVAGGRVVEPYLWLRARSARDTTARAVQTQQPPERLTRGVRLTDVSFTYPGTQRAVLSHVDVELPAGAVVALVGEYGSGKSTLVKLLGRFYEPTDGVIEVDGVDLRTIDAEQWWRRSSAAFQDFGRFQTTVRESVGLGDVAAMTEPGAVEAAVEAVDGTSIVDGLPDGLDTQLGVQLGGVELSEGQWQRIALARASMRETPLLLLLDEPTASIDAPGEESIYRRFMAMARAASAATGAVTVLVSHRFSTVTEADLILVMEDGRIVERGDHASLLAARGRYAEMFGLHAAAYAAEPSHAPEEV